MISAIRSLRPNSATTGSAPSRFSSTRTTATSARARPRPRPVLDIPLMPDVNQQPDRLFPTPLKAANGPAVSHHPAAARIQPHVRRPGLDHRAAGWQSSEPNRKEGVMTDAAAAAATYFEAWKARDFARLRSV